MTITPADIPKVKIITPRRFEDARGFFSETYSKRAWEQAGLHYDFVQDNHSLSVETGTLRGLHFQRPPCAQAKLVRVTQGSVIDVAVDIRRGSPTHGRHVAVELSAQNGRQLLVPRGFAHGFCTLEPDTQVTYKVDGFYSGEHDAGVRWDDPTLAIDWHLNGREPMLSEKDAKLPQLAEFESPFTFTVNG